MMKNVTNQRISYNSTVLVAIVVLFALSLIQTQELYAQSTNYYVGGAGASDNNSGTSTEPFATIQKAATVASAGSTVNIRTGTYRETITPTNSGVTYQPDGGATVVISGFDVIDSTGWTVHSGSIYKKTITLPVNGYNTNSDVNNIYPGNTTIFANQIIRNGEMMPEARWPNLPATAGQPIAFIEFMKWQNYRQLSFDQGFGQTSLTDSQLPLSSGLTGAVLVSNGWFPTEARTVTQTGATTLTYGAIWDNSESGVWTRKAYYLTGKLALLDAENEWHYESGTLYFWQPGGGVPSGTIEYKARNWGFDIRGRQNVKIIGLTFIGVDPVIGDASSTGAVVEKTTAKFNNHHVRLDVSLWNGGISVGMPRLFGTKLLGANSVFKDNEWSQFATAGVWLGPNCRAENNLMEYIGYAGGSGCPISFWDRDDDQVVTRNTLRYVGRSCIDFGYVYNGDHLNIEISYNDMSNYGMISGDGGATYAAGQLDLNGLNYHHNWVHDNQSRTVIQQGGLNAGGYFDQASGGGTIHHNVFWGNPGADFYHETINTYRTTGTLFNIYNNTFAGTYLVEGNESSYRTYTTNPLDVQRNCIYTRDMVVGWPQAPTKGNTTFNIPSTTNPLFVGSGTDGLAYRIQTGSPAKDAGTVISGITDGSVGVPDIGAYEFGGEDWVPGYVALGDSTTVATPTFNPTGGTYTSAQSVSISTSTSGASIYYTTDGSTPNTSSTLYTAAVSVSSSTTLKAIAVKDEMTDSSVGTAVYNINESGFVTGINLGGSAVTIEGNSWLSHSSALSNGLTVVNGTTGTSAQTWNPTPADSDVTNMLNNVVWYSAADINLTQTLTNGNYNVYVWLLENYASNSRSFNLKLEGTTMASSLGTMTLGAWQKSGPYNVTVTDGALNVNLQRVTGDPVIAGIAIFSGSVAQVETPTFSPVEGTYTSVQSVTTSTTTSEASIYYTTDGSTPDSSSTLYTGAINISSTTTLKAIAIKSGMTDSDVGFAAYTINLPTGKYEAEDAQLTGGAAVNTNHTGYSGTGFVDGYWTLGASTTFSVTAAEAGRRNVTLHYSDGYATASSLSVYVNDVKIFQFDLPSTGNWNTWDDKIITLTLNQGSNTIKYKYDSGDIGSVNLDYIIVSNDLYDPSFVKGINFYGNAVTIEGNAWLSHSSALSSGLTIVNGITGTSSQTWNPTPADSDVTNMLDNVIWNSAADLNLSQTIANGIYDVYVWLLENYASSSRSFNLKFEGVTMDSNLGTMSLGNWQKHGPYTVIVADGTLNLSLQKVTGDPVIAGMALFTGGLKGASINTSLGGVTGIQNIQNKNDFIVYPNPNKGSFFVKSNFNIKELEVYNALGAKIYFRNKIGAGNNEEIDIRANTSGIYYIRLFDGEKHFTEKIIINKD